MVSSGRRWRRAASTPSTGAGCDGGHPVGVFGTLISLVISPPLGALAALLVIRALRRLARRATRRWGDAGSRWAVGDGGGAGFQPRRQRRPEGGRRDRGAAPRERADQHAGGSDLGHRRVRGGADRGHGAWADGGSFAPWAAASTASSGSRVWRPPARRPAVIFGGFAGGGADVHLSGRGVVGRGRRRWPVALAPRSLGGRPPDGRRVADHASDHRRCWRPSCSSSGGWLT